MAQGLLPELLGRPNVVIRIEPQSAVCRASKQPTHCRMSLAPGTPLSHNIVVMKSVLEFFRKVELCSLSSFEILKSRNRS